MPRYWIVIASDNAAQKCASEKDALEWIWTFNDVASVLSIDNETVRDATDHFRALAADCEGGDPEDWPGNVRAFVGSDMLAEYQREWDAERASEGRYCGAVHQHSTYWGRP